MNCTHLNGNQCLACSSPLILGQPIISTYQKQSAELKDDVLHNQVVKQTQIQHAWCTTNSIHLEQEKGKPTCLWQWD